MRGGWPTHMGRRGDHPHSLICCSMRWNPALSHANMPTRGLAGRSAYQEGGTKASDRKGHILFCLSSTAWRELHNEHYVLVLKPAE